MTDLFGVRRREDFRITRDPGAEQSLDFSVEESTRVVRRRGRNLGTAAESGERIYAQMSYDGYRSPLLDPTNLPKRPPGAKR